LSPSAARCAGWSGASTHDRSGFPRRNGASPSSGQASEEGRVTSLGEPPAPGGARGAVLLRHAQSGARGARRQTAQGRALNFSLPRASSRAPRARGRAPSEDPGRP
jgi:hypothetical protein